jgi:alanyl-tRNA synthetase
MAKSRELIYGACAQLKVKPAELKEKIQTQMDEIKVLKRAIESFKAKEAAGEVDRFLFAAHNVSGIKVITAVVPGAEPNKLRQMGDLLRDKDASVAAVLATVNGEKVTFLAVCGKEAIAKGVRAGDLVKTVCVAAGGSGGGKPDSAMGGGKDATKVDNALALVDDFVASKIK